MENALVQHAGIRGFMARRGLPQEAVRGDGRLTLVIDGRYRLHLRPDEGGRLLLSAKIAPLPGECDTPASRQFIGKMMNRAAGLLRDNAATLSLDPEKNALMLRQSLSASLPAEEIESEVGDFTNALHFWVRTGKNP